MRTLSTPNVLMISWMDMLPPSNATVSGISEALNDPVGPEYFPVVNTARKICNSCNASPVEVYLAASSCHNNNYRGGVGSNIRRRRRRRRSGGGRSAQGLLR